jgi:GNAT superfamily N-acetyltransferase
MTVRIETLRGPALSRALDGVAALRIAVFREWPYLYDGSLAYETQYLGAFAAGEGAILVCAYDGDRLAGASTAAPLVGQPSYATEPVAARGLDLARFFYFGESVLEPAYRGQGTGVRFFAEREAAARAHGGVTTCLFCAVERRADDPRRPADHVPLDAFWRRRGYAPWPGMTTQIAWREVGAAVESAQTLQFWRKDIAP